ncbi:transcriptional regulator [Saccharomonospora cyanea NA-134]|uniref:Transcriptional regulator n=1 Tax=Saccharomonospora cyanea NA-134 TaxID=882082 RepID=H5XJ51_9PSEU|nr:transcriptional regulator [Saccharomonospora cyanea NA-134]
MLPPAELRGRISWQLAEAGRRAQRMVVDRLSEAGLTKNHHGALAVLIEAEGITQADLGRRLGIDRSDVVAMINALEEEGLVRRTPDRTDRRRNIVVATPRAHEVLGRASAVVDEVNEMLLEGLSDDERATLLALLTRITGMPCR